MVAAPALGIHIGLQDTTPAAVVDLAVRAEAAGFDWVSVWDHLYSSSEADGGSLEAVAMHAAVATATTRVRCGTLVYCAAFRHPAILAKAAATIDLLSGGRADVGLGAGWYEREHDAFGFPFRSAKGRLDLLEESARCVRALLHEDEVDHEGEHVVLRGARCEPRPVQARLPIWIGGTGEQRTLRIVARHADGWNAPFLPPKAFAAKRAVLHERCAEVGRDPGEIRCAANVGFAATEADLAHHTSTMVGGRSASTAGVVVGHGEAIAEAVAAYASAGADQVNVAFRAPFDLHAFDVLVDGLGIA